MANPLLLTIFHTNDLHGRLEPLSRLSAFARRLRSEAEAAGRIVYQWDAGDAADRRIRIVSATKGAAFSPILNAMGVSLQTVGNDLALTYGPQVMAEVARRASFPILGANFRDGDGPLPAGLHETARLPLPGCLTLGVLGLTANFRDIYSAFGLSLPDFIPLAADLVRQLRQEGCSPVVVLSHLGIEDGRRLAQAVSGIDLIIGGHSHTRLPEGERVNGVLIAQAGEYAECLGRVDLEIDPRTGQVLSSKAQVVEVPADEPPDEAVVAAIAAAEAEVEAMLATPVGELLEPFELDYQAECPLGSLAADALLERMRRWGGAEAAILACGQLNSGLPSGPITLGQLNMACFSTANPAVTPVTGTQITAALENGLDPDVSTLLHHGLRGAPVGLLQISGLQAEYDPDAPVGQRLRRVWLVGEPLDPQRVYRLAHTDFETYAPVRLLSLEPSQDPGYEMPVILPEVLEDYLKRHSPVGRPTTGRWNRIGDAG